MGTEAVSGLVDWEGTQAPVAKEDFQGVVNLVAATAVEGLVAEVECAEEAPRVGGAMEAVAREVVESEEEVWEVGDSEGAAAPAGVAREGGMETEVGAATQSIQPTFLRG